MPNGARKEKLSFVIHMKLLREFYTSYEFVSRVFLIDVIMAPLWRLSAYYPF